MFNLKLNNESGMVMVVALVVTLLGTLLASSFMSSVIYEAREADRQIERSHLLFLAEAGLEKSLYWLNSDEDLNHNPWKDEAGSVLDPPLQYISGQWSCGHHPDPGIDDPLTTPIESYEVWLYDSDDVWWLPVTCYMIQSTGVITYASGEREEYSVSATVAKLDGLPVPAALSVLDAADPEDELSKFQSAVWTIDGRNHDLFSGNLINPPILGAEGLPGIAIANDDIDPVTLNPIDDLAQQLDKFPDKPHRLNAVKGWIEELGGYVQGGEAIVQDPDLPKTLDPYATYFQKIAIDISGPEFFIPDHLLGAPGEYQILYADLSKGPKKIAGGATGHGILILDGIGEFEMGGLSTWNGLIICAENSNISLKGGGNTPAHINGGLMIANGFVEMNGTADVTYCKEAIDNINSWLLLYQVYAWSGDWGIPLGIEDIVAN